MREVVSNTSPLLNLHQLGSIDLLPALYAEVLVPMSVVDELSAGRAAGTTFRSNRSTDPM
jgi:predicted nucleic acid-binding protein